MRLLSSDDGASLVRVIAGEVAGSGARAPRRRRSPICTRPWLPARGWRCRGRATSTPSLTSSPGGASPATKTGRWTRASWRVFGTGDALTIRAAARQPLDRRATAGKCSLLGGLADPRSRGPLRPLRHEHARGDHPGCEGLPERAHGRDSRRARPPPHQRRPDLQRRLMRARGRGRVRPRASSGP